jgi:hypothetical protein
MSTTSRGPRRNKAYTAMKSYEPGAPHDPPRTLPPGVSPGDGAGRWEPLTGVDLPDGSAMMTWAWRWADAAQATPEVSDGSP